MDMKKIKDFQKLYFKPENRITTGSGIEVKKAGEFSSDLDLPGRPGLPAKRKKVAFPDFKGLFKAGGEKRGFKCFMSQCDIKGNKEVTFDDITRIADYLSGVEGEDVLKGDRNLGLNIRLKEVSFCEIKNKIDLDREGKLSKEELVKVKEEIRLHIEKKVIPGISEKIDFTQYKGFTTEYSAGLKNDIIKCLEENFTVLREKFNFNEDGKLTGEDLELLGEEMEYYIEEELMPAVKGNFSAIYEKLDINLSSRISKEDVSAVKEEIKIYIEEEVMPLVEEKLAELTEKLDFNQDGKLTKEDMELLLDINEDGEINEEDMELWKEKMALWIAARPVYLEKSISIEEIRTVLAGVDIRGDGKINRDSIEFLAGFLLGDTEITGNVLQESEFFTKFSFASLGEFGTESVEFTQIISITEEIKSRKENPAYPLMGFEISNMNSVNKSIMSIVA